MRSAMSGAATSPQSVDYAARATFLACPGLANGDRRSY